MPTGLRKNCFISFQVKATLRTPEGFQKSNYGDIVFFEEGPTAPISCIIIQKYVYLSDIRSAFGIDVTDYPDSGKLMSRHSGKFLKILLKQIL